MQSDMPLRRHPKLSIAIPSSLFSDVQHLREKTLKIGLVGRALAIFRVDEIVIFPDELNKNQKTNAQLIATVLSYLETPQYLRKHLFKIRPELGYVGILPPLRTLHHPLRNRKRDLYIGEYREGVVTSSNKNGTLINIGVEHPILVSNTQLNVNKRVTVKIIERGKHPKAKLITKDEIDVYWGYKVTISDLSFGRMLEKQKFDLVISTSRCGELVMGVADQLLQNWRISKNVLVSFGAMSRGLKEIVKQEYLELEDLSDFIINTVPKQGTKTVRTEEAIYVTLAILNVLVS